MDHIITGMIFAFGPITDRAGSGVEHFVGLPPRTIGVICHRNLAGFGSTAAGAGAGEQHFTGLGTGGCFGHRSAVPSVGGSLRLAADGTGVTVAVLIHLGALPVRMGCFGNFLCLFCLTAGTGAYSCALCLTGSFLGNLTAVPVMGAGILLAANGTGSDMGRVIFPAP